MPCSHLFCSVHYKGTDLDQKKPPPHLSAFPICLLPPGEGTHRASVEAEASQHGPCDRIKRTTKNRGFLDEGAEAAVIMGTRQINHPWQVRQEVTQLLLHLLPTEFIIGMFQVVVCDQIGAACQLGATQRTQGEEEQKNISPNRREFLSYPQGK